MRIYPTPGLRVRDPIKRDFLPEEGREVPDGDLYWVRRLNCKDATLTPPETAGLPADTEADTSILTEGSDTQ